MRSSSRSRSSSSAPARRSIVALRGAGALLRSGSSGLPVVASPVSVVALLAVRITGRASGAAMGVMIAFAMANPDRQFFLFPLPIPVTARALVIIIVAMNILMGFQGGATSVSTHLGGMAVGYGYMKLIPRLHERQRDFWRKRYAKKDPADPLGEAVDNIFKFDEEKRKRGDR